MNDDESCGIRMKVGVSNEKFKNTLVIHFPSIVLQDISIELQSLKNFLRV